MKIIYLFSFLGLILLISSCSAPRTILHSGRVTKHKTFRAGADYSFNFSTAPVGTAYSTIKSISKQLINKDTIVLNDQIFNLSKTAVSYVLDPIASGYDIYARYGIFRKTDIGYKYSSGCHVFDVRYQFTGNSNYTEAIENKSLCGSVGLQYSIQKFELPSLFGLVDVQKILGLEVNRKDFLVPLAFSTDFGNTEKIGSFAFGAIYNLSLIHYSFNPENIYQYDQSNVLTSIPIIDEKKVSHSVGLFVNCKVGYKFIYFIPSLAMYYQNYGTYKLIGGTSKIKGFTIIPSLGLQFNFRLWKSK